MLNAVCMRVLSEIDGLCRVRFWLVIYIFMHVCPLIVKSELFSVSFLFVSAC